MGRKGKNLWTENKKGEKIALNTLYSEREETMFIANKIDELVKQGYNYSDFAILYRMNALSNSLEQSLSRKGVPYRMIGGLRFYDREEVRDIIAYLQVVDNPKDDVRLKRIINKPKRSIGDVTIGKASQLAILQDVSLFEILKNASNYADLKRSAKKCEEFCELIEKLNHLNNNGSSIQEIYKEILKSTNYVDGFIRREKDNIETRIENIDELLTSIVKYEQENDEPSLSGFLEEISLFTDLDNYDNDAQTVILMTLHSAKGLEFPVVFITGMEDGIFPSRQNFYSPDEMEEERRLAYVGITRAKEKLFICNASERMLFGTTQRNSVSRFVKEIPPYLIENISEKSSPHQRVQPVFQATKPNQAFGSKIDIQKPMQQTTSSVDFKVGQQVRHNVFGVGLVVSTMPLANDMMLEIAFDKVGTKKVMAKYSKIEII